MNKTHILKFRAADVGELVAHAKAAKKHRPYYEDMGIEKDTPYITLVADHGVYLMSGGSPPMKVAGDKEKIRVVYAQGYDPYTEAVDSWHPRQRALNTRGDFSLRLPVRKLPARLDARSFGYVVVEWEDGQDCMIFGPDNYAVSLSDN